MDRAIYRDSGCEMQHETSFGLGQDSDPCHRHLWSIAQAALLIDAALEQRRLLKYVGGCKPTTVSQPILRICSWLKTNGLEVQILACLTGISSFIFAHCIWTSHGCVQNWPQNRTIYLLAHLTFLHLTKQSVNLSLADGQMWQTA